VIKLALLLLLLFVLPGCSSAKHASSGGPVPWVNRPRPHYALPGPKLVHYPTTAAPCRASQLRVSRRRNAAATSNLLEELVFKNVGARTCLLRGYPTISADTPTGRRVLHPGHATFFGPLFPSDMPPGGHVFLDFGTSDCVCHCVRPGPAHYRNFGFTLPSGGSVSAGRVSIDVDCFLDVSAFGLPERYLEPRARRGTVGTLKARISVPRTVRAGATIHYTVTLTNATDVAVSLRPCPSYTDGLGRSFGLNCDTVHGIPPHGHVEYEMRLQLPEKARDGIAKIAWRLDTATGPATAGVVRIVSG